MPVSFLLENTKDLPLQEAGTQSVSDLALGYQPLDSSSVAISALDVLGVSRASAHLNGDMLKRKRDYHPSRAYRPSTNHHWKQ